MTSLRERAVFGPKSIPIAILCGIAVVTGFTPRRVLGVPDDPKKKNTAEDAETEKETKPSSRFEDAIRAFEAADRERPPKMGGILFLGSSSIRLWKLDRSFPDLQAINRGFGGSEISDSIEFAPRIVLPYRPKTIVFYAGDNDVAAGKPATRVEADFRRFAALVREKLPKTRILFVSIKPSLARWKLVEVMRDANRRIRSFCDEDELLGYVDIDRPMLGEDGRPRPELFASDGLHLSDAGYKLWTEKVRSALEEIDKAESGEGGEATGGAADTDAKPAKRAARAESGEPTGKGGPPR